MSHELTAFLLALGLFLSMLLCLEASRWLGLRRLKAESQGTGEGVRALDGAVFALLGLLIAFSFSGASSRFDARRQMILEETNDIGTAYLRIDLLPADAQPELRENFRRYVDTRLEVYRKLPDVMAAKKSLAKAKELQRQLWRQVVAAVQKDGAAPKELGLLLSALNMMINHTTNEALIISLHPPAVVFGMLFGLALISSFLAGYRLTGSTVQCQLHMLCFALVIAITVYVILDMEYPRLGLIRVDAFDQALVDLRASMNG